jgi:hypothetical protein
VAAGCGENDLNGAALSNEIEASLKRQRKVSKIEVKCPPKIKREAGAKASCPYITDREAGIIRIVQQDDEGSVRWQVDPKSSRPL